MTLPARAGRADYALLGTIIVLLILGLQALYSSSFALAMTEFNDPIYFVARQAIWALIGGILLLITWRIPYWKWKSLSTVAIVAAIGALAIVMVPGVGVSVYGAQRWIAIGPLPPVQPGEFAKLGVILYFAAWLSDRPERLNTVKEGLLPFGLVLGLAAGLILIQPDLGSAAIVLSIALVLYFIAGAPLQQFALLLGAIAAGVTVFAGNAAYRVGRIEAFLDPWKDPQGSGFHIIQSLIAIGSGGLFGLGFGSSRQKFFYVPSSHTDAIFAIIGEELGLVGTLLVIGLFVLLGWRGFRTALRCPDRFGALLAAGITTWFCLQAFVNIGGITRTIPWTGIPLPFISFGGSALSASMAGVGVLLNISRFAARSQASAERPDSFSGAKVAGRVRSAPAAS